MSAEVLTSDGTLYNCPILQFYLYTLIAKLHQKPAQSQVVLSAVFVQVEAQTGRPDCALPDELHHSCCPERLYTSRTSHRLSTLSTGQVEQHT